MVSALKFARSHVGNRKPTGSGFLANSGPIFFSFHLIEMLFGRVLVIVVFSQLRLCKKTS